MKITVYFIILNVILSYQSIGQDDSHTSIVDTKLEIHRGAKYQLQTFADSINTYSKTRIFPSFLNDVCLDWNGAYWPGFHSPTAVRWEILSLVKNPKSLELLVKNKTEAMRRKCDRKWTYKGYPGDLTPPMNNISTYSLIIRRLKELRK